MGRIVVLDKINLYNTKIFCNLDGFEHVKQL
jgi:hypothetical protein